MAARKKKGFAELLHDSVPKGQSENDMIKQINDLKAKKKEEAEEKTSVDFSPQAGFTNDSAEDEAATEDVEVDPVESSEDNEEPEASEAPQTVTLKKDQLENILGQAVKQALKPFEDKVSEIEKEKKSLEDKLQETQAEAEKKVKAASDELEAVKSVFAVLGHTAPTAEEAKDMSKGTPGFLSFGRSDHQMADAVKHFEEVLEDKDICPTASWVDPLTGDVHRQRDTRYLRRFYRGHRKELRDGFEKFAKANGFLQGSGVTRNVDSVTLGRNPGTVPDAFLAYLSTMMRETKSPRYIYHLTYRFRYLIGGHL